jgi:Uma2 family endonuclease
MDLRNPEHLIDDLVDFDDFCDLVADGQKADLIDGVIHMASPDSFRATRLEKFIDYLIEGFIMSHRIEGAVVGSRFAFKISDRRAPEPDVAYIGPDRMQHVEANYMVGGPDIAVEIVSRESRQRDYHEKRELYRQADVREYWIIDPIQRRCEFLRLRESKYEIVPLEANHIFRSEVLPGFWLNVDWLIGDSLPNTAECLREILTA